MQCVIILVMTALVIPCVYGGIRNVFNVQDDAAVGGIYEEVWREIGTKLSSWKVRRLRSSVRFMNAFDRKTEPSATCTLCKALVATAKGLVLVTSDEVALGIAKAVCRPIYQLPSEETLNTDIICSGLMDINVPHGEYVLLFRHMTSPADFCLNFNVCFPKRDGSRITLPNVSPSTGNDVGSNTGMTLEERKQNAIKFVQLTDVHFEPDYAEGSNADCGLPVCCVSKYGEGDAYKYGEYTCNVPVRTMELFFHKTAELNPDFVIYSGDTAPHTQWDESYESHVNCSRVFLEKSREILAGYRVYPNVGNHDVFPANLFSVEHLQPYTQDMLDEIAADWSDVAGLADEQIQTIRTGGYYTMLIHPGLRLLSVNTNYWYSYNFYNPLNEMEIENMKQFMLTTLQMARDSGEKVLLVAHHPPSYNDLIVAASRSLEEIVATFSDVILFQIGGHAHDDRYTVLSDEAGTPLATSFVSPPISTFSKINPSMRLFYLDPVTFELIDFEQYGFNLLQASASTQPPAIDLIYSAVAEYGLADMSPSSWQDLTLRMVTDDTLLQRYYQNHWTRFNASATCDATCKAHLLCSASFYSYDRVVYCKEQWTAS